MDGYQARGGGMSATTHGLAHRELFAQRLSVEPPIYRMAKARC